MDDFDKDVTFGGLLMGKSCNVLRIVNGEKL